MATRAKQLLKNYIRPHNNIEINNIKKIKKNKVITKMIDIINYNNNYDFQNGDVLYYENVFVYYNYNIEYEILFLYDKENNCLMTYYDSLYYNKYYRKNNYNIIKCYYWKNICEVTIYKNKKKIYSYFYCGKIKNYKYKSNYKTIYICFV